VTAAADIRNAAADLRRVFRPGRPAAPTEDAFALHRLADRIGHDIEIGEAVEAVLDGKYDTAADVLDELADAMDGGR
jgi:hypothetical protein